MFYCVFARIYCELDDSVFRVEIVNLQWMIEEPTKKGALEESTAVLVSPDMPTMCLRVIFYVFLSWFLLLVK